MAIKNDDAIIVFSSIIIAGLILMIIAFIYTFLGETFLPSNRLVTILSTLVIGSFLILFSVLCSVGLSIFTNPKIN